MAGRTSQPMLSFAKVVSGVDSGALPSQQQQLQQNSLAHNGFLADEQQNTDNNSADDKGIAKPKANNAVKSRSDQQPVGSRRRRNRITSGGGGSAECRGVAACSSASHQRLFKQPRKESMGTSTTVKTETGTDEDSNGNSKRPVKSNEASVPAVCKPVANPKPVESPKIQTSTANTTPESITEPAVQKPNDENWPSLNSTSVPESGADSPDPTSQKSVAQPNVPSSPNAPCPETQVEKENEIVSPGRSQKVPKNNWKKFEIEVDYAGGGRDVQSKRQNGIAKSRKSHNRNGPAPGPRDHAPAQHKDRAPAASADAKEQQPVDKNVGCLCLRKIIARNRPHTTPLMRRRPRNKTTGTLTIPPTATTISILVLKKQPATNSPPSTDQQSSGTVDVSNSNQSSNTVNHQPAVNNNMSSSASNTVTARPPPARNSLGGGPVGHNNQQYMLNAGAIGNNNRHSTVLAVTDQLDNSATWRMAHQLQGNGHPPPQQIVSNNGGIRPVGGRTYKAGGGNGQWVDEDPITRTTGTRPAIMEGCRTFWSEHGQQHISAQPQCGLSSITTIWRDGLQANKKFEENQAQTSAGSEKNTKAYYQRNDRCKVARNPHAPPPLSMAQRKARGPLPDWTKLSTLSTMPCRQFLHLIPRWNCGPQLFATHPAALGIGLPQPIYSQSAASSGWSTSPTPGPAISQPNGGGSRFSFSPRFCRLFVPDLHGASHPYCSAFSQ
uniref:Uncharacterized protein n=1 Tax=Ditylenchus dipsaci TaxID=166011 RepID=A0A915CQY5_9BILA